MAIFKTNDQKNSQHLIVILMKRCYFQIASKTLMKFSFNIFIGEAPINKPFNDVIPSCKVFHAINVEPVTEFGIRDHLGEHAVSFFKIFLRHLVTLINAESYMFDAYQIGHISDVIEKIV